MYELAPLLLQIPPARMFEEVLKLFMSGYALETFHLLREFGLFQMLFPETEESFAHYQWSMPLIEKALASTDDRIREDKPVTPA
ncbi:polynucleotide adenylyltransferase PcnB, partial [Pseudoalteromonas sp. SIMBA_162]